MTAALKIVAGIVVVLIILVALAIAIVPRFLDRVYYSGPSPIISTASVSSIPMAMPTRSGCRAAAAAVPALSGVI